MDQLLTPRGLVLTLASFFKEGWVVGTRFDSGREVAFCWGWAISFGVACLCCFVLFVLFVFVFFCLVLLDTCPFLGRCGTGVFCGSILGLKF